MKRILWNTGRKEIDEIVLRNVDVHIEQMSDDCWWIGISLPDGTYWAGNFHTNSIRSRMTFTEQESDVEWDRDEEHA